MVDQGLLLFFPALLLVTYLHGSVIRFLQVHFQQGWVVFLSVLEIVLKVTLIWIFGNNNYTASDLLAAAALSEFIPFVVALIATRHLIGNIKTTKQPFRLREKAASWKTLLKEGRPTWLLAISERVLGRDIDILLLGIMAGPLEVAKYALPFTLAAISISVATSTFQSTTNLTTFTEATQKDGSGKSKNILKALFEYWALFVLPIATGGIILGDKILHLLYGEAADGTGLVTALLFASFAFSNLSGLAKDALQGIGDDRSPAKVHLMGGGTNLVLSLLFIPIWGAAGAAAATLISTILIAYFQISVLPVSLRGFPSPRSFVAVFVSLLAMFSAVHFSQDLLFEAKANWTSTSLSIMVGGFAYCLGLLTVGPKTTLGERITNVPPVLGFARRVL